MALTINGEDTNKLTLIQKEGKNISVTYNVDITSAIFSLICKDSIGTKFTKENIDFVMRNGLGLPLGPFEMADKIGLDRVERWMENLFQEFGDKKYKASPILKRLVRANHLGRKTCEGFYKYDHFGKKLKGQGIKIQNC